MYKVSDFMLRYDDNGFINYAELCAPPGDEEVTQLSESDKDDIKDALCDWVKTGKYPAKVWSDGDPEEPSTRVYISTGLDGKVEVIQFPEYLELIDAINRGNKVLLVNIEDSLL